MKKILFSLGSIFLSSFIYAQNSGQNFELHETLSGVQEYEASEYINMIPSFNYEALNVNDEFEAKINVLNVYPPTSGTTGGPGGETGSSGRRSVKYQRLRYCNLFCSTKIS